MHDYITTYWHLPKKLTFGFGCIYHLFGYIIRICVGGVVLSRQEKRCSHQKLHRTYI